ncbi:MAG: single-stranded-DNA-specific exonuclease RecJ [Alphaproteobacteria bacterium]
MAAEAGEAFLGVARSLTGKRWVRREADARAALAIAQRLDAPEIVGRILAGRGIAPEDAGAYLNPTLRDSLPDPAHLRDMELATERLVRAVADGERIVVFGDYDVDGATSAALLVRFLRAVGATADAYIPDRVKEGYGPNGPALERLRRDGADVVVTVDCGIAAFDALAIGADVGLDIIVVDHHVAEPRLPRAVAVVNPNRLDDSSPHGQLAAVGVALLLAISVNRALRDDGYFGPDRPEPDLMRWLDLVALGTVCDVVPLTGVNRALVTQGLKVMAARGNAGLVALAEVAGIDRRPDAYHAGFVLGPRVNAGGRVGAADLGFRLLSTEDATEARALAETLDRHNAERRRIEAEVLAAAIAQMEGDGDSAEAHAGLVLVAGAGWHPGVIGIVASRLRERYDRPACVVALPGHAAAGDAATGGGAKGSGRSVPGVDLGAAVIAARQAGLLTNGGGHAMAAGFTVAPERLGELRDFLGERMTAALAAAGGGPRLSVDGALLPAAADFDLAALIDSLGPFGSGNPQPRFALPGVRVVRSDVVGTEHVRCILAGPGGGRLKAMAFRSLDGPVGPALLDRKGAALHIAGTLRTDEWGGRRAAQFFIEDVARPTAA